MNYELAKELKKADWPFVEIKPGMHQCREYVDFNPEGDPKIGPQHFFLPTLSELIEACGEKFFSLSRHANVWQTNWRDGFGGDTAGSTPEEAVARLWLALNNK